MSSHLCSQVSTLIIGISLVIACSVSGEDRSGLSEIGSVPAEITPSQDVSLSPNKSTPSPAARETEEVAQTKLVYLQPLGRKLPEEAMVVVENALREVYGFSIKRAAPVPLPRFAYYAPRKRYRAEKLLQFLNRIITTDAFRILGLTAVDISTTAHGHRDWGIMGYASIDGRLSVMSMFRCRRGARSEEHARERLGKVAVHEIGHTLGLEHCPNHGCLMEDARGTNTTTDREYELCSQCRAFLTKRGFNLPPSPNLPWSRP